MNKDYAFVIPAYNPDEKLIEVVNEILNKTEMPVFVIDDGSHEESKHIFDEFNSKKYVDRVILIEHAINLGKGAALKTVFNLILTKYTNINGVVTLDSDGQHSINDCLRVMAELKEDKKAFVLGYRTFSTNIPLKSYIGNNISKFIYKILLGKTFKDTQTGLRGISKEFMKKCLTIKSNRFEFETEQLAIASRNTETIKIVEIPIQTIYIENNRKTSFRPLVDSFKIYFVLFRYGLSSIITAVVDFIIFLIAMKLEIGVLIANLLARTVSIFVQYFLLNKIVFYTKNNLKSFVLFVLYVYVMGTISSITQIYLTETFGLSLITSKLIVEILLFFVNFAFLRLYIFNNKG